MTASAAASGLNVAGFADKLRELMLAKIAADKLVLPPMPTTASRVMEMLDRGNPDTSRVTSVLESDPVMSLDILRIANSALYSPKVPIDSLNRAVSQIGQRNLRNVLTAAAARRIFNSRNPEVRDIFNKLWEHSVAVAIAARQIAVHAALEDKDVPYMAGLLHDVGKPVVGSHLLELERAVARSRSGRWLDTDTWMQLVDGLHRDVGLAIARKWKLPEAVCQAIEDCVEYDAADRKSSANAVRFANALAKREGVVAGEADIVQVNTVLMIGRSILGLEDEAIASMASAVHEAAAGLEA
ncbi:MAG: HDOD domain-containing protein [Myxococcales bacterium]|nr:HDOD domain-containing protein [Myxococcales bacterium]